jgi:hypothetical protein
LLSLPLPNPPNQLAEPTSGLGSRPAAFAEEDEDFLAAEQRGIVDWRGAALIGERVRTGVEEERGDICIALKGDAA